MPEISTPRLQTAPGMLTVQLEIPIAAAVPRVWEALTTQAELWWPRSFLVAGDAMRFEPVLGGRLYEQDASGSGAIWYTVYAIAPHTSIDLVGQLSPAYGGPAQSLLRLELKVQGAHTILALTDAVIGNVHADSAVSLDKGWRDIFDDGLRAFVESTADASTSDSSAAT